MLENTQQPQTQVNSNNNSRDECINVVVRIRGKGNDETGKCSLLNIIDNQTIQVENKTFYYDYVANMNSTQEELFQHCAKRICDNSLNGYNGTIFAYGQTGSGKTFTLLGRNIMKFSENKRENFSLDNTNIEMNDLSQDNDIMNMSMNTNINNPTSNLKRLSTSNITSNNQSIYNYDINDQGIGLLPRIIYYLFQNINSQKNDRVEFKLKISYLEIYQENISDLLNPDSTRFVQLRDIGSSIILDGLRKLIISSPEEALRYIIQGNKLRHTASTLMNNESSRSHAVISIYIEKTISPPPKFPNQAPNPQSRDRAKIQKSVFHIIDLAGSERQNKTGTTGERTREAGSINKSLLNLSIVIREIINNKKQIPYRDSKLTHLLRDSLGGNAKTSIIAAVSPFDVNLSETISTLNFAQNAKKVKNHAVVNEELSAAENMREMKILKKYNSVVEENLRLKQELIKYQKDNSNLAYCLRDVEGIDKGLDEFLKEMNSLQEKNAKLRDKIEKSDLEIKIREKKIESLKEQINNYIQNLRNLIKEKNEYMTKNIILSGQIKEEENEKIKLENHYKEQMSILEQNNIQTEQIIKNKGILIEDLTQKLNEYMAQISTKDKKVNELMISLEKKQNEINEINNQKNTEKRKIENLTKKINQYNIENELKQKEIDELRKNNNEIKDKGKNLLKKYDENINKNSDEITELKNTIKDRDKKIENAKKLYHNLEQFKILLENKLEEKSNNINSYLNEISDLNQKNRILKAKYDTLKTEYDKVNIDFDSVQENNSINTNNLNHSKNSIQIPRKNQTKKINNKMNSKFGLNNSTNNAMLNIENTKYKKLYDELKKKYDTTLKNISGGKKIKTVQDLIDKLDLTEKDLNECRRIMNSSFNKIQDILSKDIFISEISNQPFDFNMNNSFESNIEQKFFVIFEKFVEFHMLRENQLKNLKEQNEVLNQNIHLNEEKKELFELNNEYNNNINKLVSNAMYKSIAKNRRGYLFKDLSTNTKKAFDGYNKEMPEILDLNKENENNCNINNNNFQIGKNNGKEDFRMMNINKGNMINSKKNLNNNNDNFSSKKLNIHFNILQSQNKNK